MNFDLISFPNPDDLARAGAAAWLDEIESARQSGKTYCVALSGGRITQKFFAATVEMARSRNGSFEHVGFFWADERCVPPSDPESNFKLADEKLFVPLKIAERQIHRLRGEITAAEAVKIAREELGRIATNNAKGQPVLDLVLLGMGEDGHVASLFPNASPQIWETTASFLVIENSPKPPPTRISLSFAAIVAARKVWVLASGAGKSDALRESLDSIGRTPLARVLQARTATRIFSDISGI
jgi:6-phosphogluconolactonase